MSDYKTCGVCGGHNEAYGEKVLCECHKLRCGCYGVCVDDGKSDGWLITDEGKVRAHKGDGRQGYFLPYHLSLDMCQNIRKRLENRSW